MALDVQSNWDVEMFKSRKIINKPTEIEWAKKVVSNPPYFFDSPSQFSHNIQLPSEIISIILSFVPRRESSQGTLWACTLISRTWYSASISILYERPYLNGGNFNDFVTTVCPSKNAHIRQSPLSILVRRLDMGELVHNASKSLTARLLGRLKGNIEEFVAPQASFAINSFAALSKCTKLRHLDLSLISASISINQLFKTLQSLQNLEVLYFPRSSSHDDETQSEPYAWPPHLKSLHLAGGVDNMFLTTHLSNAPQSLTRVSIQHCKSVRAYALKNTFEVLALQLQHLTIRHPMAQLFPGSLDDVITQLPRLIALRISADYITSNAFMHLRFPSQLRILDLDCSPQANANIEVDSRAILIGILEGFLPDLRSVRVSARLAWDATEGLRYDAGNLSDELEEQEKKRPLGIPTGVWLNLPD